MLFEHSHTREILSATGALSEHLASPASYACARCKHLATKGLIGNDVQKRFELFISCYIYY